MTTNWTGYDEAYRAAKAGTLKPGTVRIRLVGGRNSGVEGTLTGTYRVTRSGTILLGADLKGIGVRDVTWFEVI